MKETKFKDTELGKIPEEWDYGKFEDYLDKFSAGATPYRGIASNFIGTIPWVSSGELNYNYTQILGNIFPKMHRRVPTLHFILKAHF